MTGVAHVVGVEVRRGRTTTLRDVGLTLHVGVTGVLGPNGAGKTTLFRVLVGLQRVARGRVATPSRVGYLPQDLRLPKGFTAIESLAYLGWVRGLTNAAARTEAERCLDLVDLTSRGDAKVRTLSGGMQQRLVIATAFVGDPELVVLDEPTVGLDLAQQQFFRDLVVREGGRRAIVMSSHTAGDIVSTCSSVVVLDAGRVVFDGSRDSFDSLAPETGSPEALEGPTDAVALFERRYLKLLDSSTSC